MGSIYFGGNFNLSYGYVSNENLLLTSTTCGSGTTAVHTSINLGCENKGNGIYDLLFAIIRFLSDGVGLVVIASIIVGGIQYIGSSGDPNATNKARTRIRSSIVALIVFIFAYAILNYIVPGAFLK
jgi:hypothetical protein